MTGPQPTILVIVALAFGFFAWGRWRGDLVAVVALLAALLSGVVPLDRAFSGFSDPAITVIVGMMILSGAVRNSGLFDAPIRGIDLLPRRPGLRGSIVGGLVALVSSVVNHADATASFVPAAQSTARHTGRSVVPLVTSLALVSLLGGTMTLVGTIPNILVSGVRRATEGADFGLFAFAPVGLALSIIGVIAVAVFWRGVAKASAPSLQTTPVLPGASFTSEVLVPPESPLVGQSVRDLQNRIKARVTVSAIIREDLRRLHPRPDWRIEPDDILVLACDPEALQRLMELSGLQIAGRKLGDTNPEQIGVVEAVIAPGSELIGASQASSNLEERFRVSLLAIGRHGERLAVRLRRIKFRAGDVLLLQGQLDTMATTVAGLGCLPLAERRLRLGRRRQIIVPAVILVVALALAASAILPIAVALLCGLVVLVLLRITTLAELYASVSWPTIVQIAALLPLGGALRATGAVDLVDSAVLRNAGAVPPQLLVWLVLIIALAATALARGIPTAVFLAPLAIGLASRGGINADPLLMAVAVGASCDVLTPLRVGGEGHGRDTQGGDLDTRRLGVALAVAVALVGPPLILLFWPLTP